MNDIYHEQPNELEQVRDWYLNIYKSLESYKKEIYSNLGSRNSNISFEFLGLTEKELEKKFQEYFKELSFTICLNYAASIEASIQTDFKFRVINKKKDIISRKLRDLANKENTLKISLTEILLVWKENFPELKKIINQYEDILKFRHWLAHGRHWVLKVKIYEENLVYSQGKELLSRMSSII